MTKDNQRAAFDAWKNVYALTLEPNYNSGTEYDCNAAFNAGWKAAIEHCHSVAPVNDNAACGVQNAIHAPQDTMSADEWLRDHEALLHRATKAGIVCGLAPLGTGEGKLAAAEAALMAHARRRIKGE